EAERPAARKAARRPAEEDGPPDKARNGRGKAKAGVAVLLLALLAAGGFLAAGGALVVAAFVWPGFLKSAGNATTEGKGGPDVGDAPLTDCSASLAFLPRDTGYVAGLDVAALRGNPG